jgi:hypothetical protein
VQRAVLSVNGAETELSVVQTSRPDVLVVRKPSAPIDADWDIKLL